MSGQLAELSPDSTRISQPHPSRWKIEDLIDFEFFLSEDRQADAAALQERDRGILLASLKRRGGGEGAGEIPPRSLLFRHWVQARRSGGTEQELLPGRMFAQAHGLMWKLATVVGLVIGVGAATGLLRYDGVQPVNVAVYLGTLVLLQVLLVLVAAGAVLLRKSKLLSFEGNGWTGLLRGVWTKLAAQVYRNLGARMQGERRTQIEAFWGTFRSYRGLYGSVFHWPMVSLLQWFGITFNLGVLAATLWLVTVSDRAFGWQSAVQFEAEQVHAIVKVVALPWSWWLPEGTGLPTLAEINGSQIILKNGIKSLATTDLVSWWPFLCLAVAVYGLAPRVGLWLVSWRWGRSALDRLDFSQVACDRLYERMTSQMLQTQGGREPDVPVALVGPRSQAVADPIPGSVRSLPANSAVLLLEPEIEEWIDKERLGRVLSQQCQVRPGLFLPWPTDPLESGIFWGELKSMRWTDNRPLVVVLQEAWQPPIAENMNLFRQLRQVLGKEAKLMVALIGKPTRENLFAPVKKEHDRIWEQRLAALGDPKLRLERLIDHNG